jgi:hypothetical protein
VTITRGRVLYFFYDYEEKLINKFHYYVNTIHSMLRSEGKTKNRTLYNLVKLKNYPVII